ncbi:hypothetical protein [Microcystis aeruginosa]|uniref:hypothetical protein n=1 Tax=Microcystis aeruginosa TaxID=1126 RepID=UPI0002FD9A5F|nr:hypothetical protein [Microcystis aeruginosa]
MGSGEVGKWGSGEVGKWGSGEVGKWGSGEAVSSPYHPKTLSSYLLLPRGLLNQSVKSIKKLSNLNF